jgi:hypothetical protein
LISIPEKKRFQELPRMLKSLYWMSPEYNAFAIELKEQAEKHGCSPHELHDNRDWPRFRW